MYYDDGTRRDPNNCLAKMLTHYDFASGNKLPKGTVIEVEPRDDMSKGLSDFGEKKALASLSILWTMKLLRVQSHRGYLMTEWEIWARCTNCLHILEKPSKIIREFMVH
jgi:hypothetical protein